MLSFFFRGEDAVGDGGGFDGGAYVVSADDVGSGEDGGYVGGGGGLLRGHRFPSGRTAQRVPRERGRC